MTFLIIDGTKTLKWKDVSAVTVCFFVYVWNSLIQCLMFPFIISANDIVRNLNFQELEIVIYSKYFTKKCFLFTQMEQQEQERHFVMRWEMLFSLKLHKIRYGRWLRKYFYICIHWIWSTTWIAKLECFQRLLIEVQGSLM